MNNKETFVFLVSIGTNSFNWEYNCDRTMEAVGRAMDVNFFAIESNNHKIVKQAKEFLYYFYSNGDKYPEWEERLK